MLRKKMLRDIRQNLSQFITIFLMVFLGVMAYSGIRSYMDGMTDTGNRFYEECNLEDLDISGSISDKDLKTIQNMDHVVDAQRKLTFIADVEGEEDKSIELNFIEENTISSFHVCDGEKFDRDSDGIWLDEYYCEKNNLNVGDTIQLKYQDHVMEAKIVGIIMTPDHVYYLKDESAVFPDHNAYGYAYMSIDAFPQEYVKASLSKELGIDESILDFFLPNFDYSDFIEFSSCMVTVDSKENVNAVKNEIDDKIEDAIAILPVEDSISYSGLKSEVEEGETYVGVFSGLFLFIALLSVITTMTRVVSKQRIQIGTLKALGFKNRKIALHYVGYGFWISLAAAICGLIMGPLFIGNVFTSMEFSYYEAPDPRAGINNKSFFIAALIVLCVTLVTYLTCRKQLKESASETLRTKMPDIKSSSLNITTKSFFKKLGFVNIWNIRDIFRNKMRTIMGIAGICGSCILLVAGFGMYDSMQSYLSWEFDTLCNFDYKLTLSENITDAQFDKLIEQYGKNSSQTLNIEIKEGDNQYNNSIFVDDSNGYVQFTDSNKDVMTLEDDSGVYITQKLASTHGYSIGDTIEWHIYGESKYYQSKIVGFNRNPQSQTISCTKEYLESIGIEYEPDSMYTNENLKKVESLKGVDLIQNKAALKEGMYSMLETMIMMIVLLVVLAAVLGSVIIYNLGILSFTEKQYQFATLKVLGFKDKQIQKIFIRQNTWLTVIAVVLGLPLGYLLTDYIFKAALSDEYDFMASINLHSYIIAIVGTFVVSILVSKFLARKIRKIDMVSSLKGNE